MMQRAFSISTEQEAIFMCEMRRRSGFCGSENSIYILNSTGFSRQTFITYSRLVLMSLMCAYVFIYIL